MPRQKNWSHLLTPQEEATLADTSRWRWVGTLGEPLPPPAEHPEHLLWMREKGNTYRPAHREIMLTFRGRAVHTLGDAVYWREPGTVMLFDHHESRDLKGAPHKTGFHTLWLHLYSRESLGFNSNSCDANGRYFQEIAPRVRSGEEVRQIMDGWDQCRAEPQNRLCWAWLKARITALLLEVLSTPLSEAHGQENRHAGVIETLERYIREHPGEDLRLESLSRLAGYSPYFFHRLFVRHTGHTPVAYIQQVRLKRARELLRKGYTIEAVAEEVGFASVSYFNHFFRKAMGHSPRAWSRLETEQRRAGEQ